MQAKLRIFSIKKYWQICGILPQIRGSARINLCGNIYVSAEYHFKKMTVFFWYSHNLAPTTTTTIIPVTSSKTLRTRLPL